MTTRSGGTACSRCAIWISRSSGFLSRPGPIAFLDLPWLPFYVGICFIFHFWIGITSLVGVIFLVTLTILTDRLTKDPSRQATGHAIKRNSLAEASRRNAEVLHAMGMNSRITSLSSEANVKYLDAQQRTSDISGGFGAISEVARMVFQSAVLGIGAYLVIRQEATGGVIIAASIIGGRALAPIDAAIANWRNSCVSTELASFDVAAGAHSRLQESKALSEPSKSFESGRCVSALPATAA